MSGWSIRWWSKTPPCPWPISISRSRTSPRTAVSSTTPALLKGEPQKIIRNDGRAFRLFRTGDAVASRNIHAAIYDFPAAVQGFLIALDSPGDA